MTGIYEMLISYFFKGRRGNDEVLRFQVKFRKNNITIIMKKQIILTLVFITSIIALRANGQALYDVDTRNEMYQNLSGSTLLTDSLAWEDTVVVINIPFSYKLNGKTITQFYMQNGAIAVTDTGKADGIFLCGAELVDRGVSHDSMKSVSPISYVVEGQSGNRILKIEVANAGFYEEWDADDTTTGYINMQLWLYEKDNVLELRFGDTYTSDFSRDFPGNLLAAIIRDIDMGKGSLGTMYSLNGDPKNPTFDSVDFTNMNGGLATLPAPGTVYRFTPKQPATSIATNAYVETFKVYPTQCTNYLVVDNPNRMNSTYRMISMSGQVLKYGSVDAGVNKLDVSTLPAGIYVVRFDYNAGFETQRIHKL